MLCGAHYERAALPAPEAQQAGSFTDKTGWRRKAFRRPDPEPDAADTAANDNATEEEPSSGSDEDVVLDEQEQDEADVTTWVDHRDAEPE